MRFKNDLRNLGYLRIVKTFETELTDLFIV